VTWPRQVDVELSPRKPGFYPGSVCVGFVVEKVALGQVLSPSTSVFPCQFHSTGAPSLKKMKKLIIFITGLHNKPHGCGASVASAAGRSPQKRSNLCTGLTTQNTTENNCIISHAQNTTALQSSFFFTGISYWSQTRDGRRSPAQTTAKDNCKLLSQY
jgi:hypothetical protein